MNHERFPSIMLSERLSGSKKFRKGAGGGGVLNLTTFLGINVINRGPHGLPRAAICVPVFLRKYIATHDFPRTGDPDPLPPPPQRAL